MKNRNTKNLQHTKRYLLLLVFVVSGLMLTKGQFKGVIMNDPVGEPVALQNTLGEELTVFDFWASWCKPCLNAIPELIAISEEYKDKGVRFVGINEDGPRNLSKVKPLVDALGIKYPVLHDKDQSFMESMNVSVFPTIIIVDKKGRTKWLHEGYEKGSGDALRKKLNKLLEAK